MSDIYCGCCDECIESIGPDGYCLLSDKYLTKTERRNTIKPIWCKLNKKGDINEKNNLEN